MRCTGTRAWLLEAELGEVRAVLDTVTRRGTASGGGDEVGRIVEHVTGCASCHGAVTALVEHTDLLHASVAAAADGTPDVDFILSEAARDTLQGDARPPWRRSPLTAVALAAAAGLAALLITDGRTPPPLPGAPLAAAPPSATGFDLRTEANVAVLPTSDPAITVIWFYE